MLIPASRVLAFINPGEYIPVRDSDHTVLYEGQGLPYEAVWKLSVDGIIEGKVIGSKLRYIRLLSDSEIELRHKLGQTARSALTDGDKSRSTVIAHTGLGCYQEPLREVKMSSDIFGTRQVDYEGDFAFKCWTHHLQTK